jgi:hypothetical protein
MQIMGRRGADGDVLAASAAFERLRPWSYDIPARRALGLNRSTPARAEQRDHPSHQQQREDDAEVKDLEGSDGHHATSLRSVDSQPATSSPTV